jgi:excisionase family DNA binding protein
MSISFEEENPDDWISASEAARLRGVSRQAIGSLLLRGRLRALKFGGKTFVSRKDVEAYVPDPGGRPRKKAMPKKRVAPKKQVPPKKETTPKKDIPN